MSSNALVGFNFEHVGPEDLESSAFQRRPCYRYIRRADRLPVEIPTEADFEDIRCPVKLFNPTGGQTWWIAAYDPRTRFGVGVGDLGFGVREFGSIGIAELVAFRGKFGLPIERDIYYTTQTVAQILAAGKA